MDRSATFYVRLIYWHDHSKTTLLQVRATTDLTYDTLVLMILEALDPSYQIDLTLIPGENISRASPDRRVLASLVGSRQDVPFEFFVKVGKRGRSRLESVEVKKEDSRNKAIDARYIQLKNHLESLEDRGREFSWQVGWLALHSPPSPPRPSPSPPTVFWISRPPPTPSPPAPSPNLPVYLRFEKERLRPQDRVAHRFWFVIYTLMSYVWEAYCRLPTDALKNELRSLKGPGLGHLKLTLTNTEDTDLEIEFYPIYANHLLTEEEKQGIARESRKFIEKVVTDFSRTNSFASLPDRSLM